MNSLLSPAVQLVVSYIMQVKQIMEEAVTRKFVHQDSSSVTSLCGNAISHNRTQ